VILHSIIRGRQTASTDLNAGRRRQTGCPQISSYRDLAPTVAQLICECRQQSIGRAEQKTNCGISDRLPSVAIDQGRRAVTEVGGLHGRRAAKTLQVR